MRHSEYAAYDTPVRQQLHAPTGSSMEDVLLKIVEMVFSQGGIAALAAVGLGYMLWRLMERQGSSQAQEWERIHKRLDNIGAGLTNVQTTTAELRAQIDGIFRELELMNRYRDKK
jgi:hypothetical protein